MSIAQSKRSFHVSVESDHNELSLLNQSRLLALEAGDVSWFEAHLADDFYQSNSDARLVSKAEFMRQVAIPSVQKIWCDSLLIKHYETIALVHATISYERSKVARSIARYTDIWAKRGGRWKCISAHVAGV